MLVQMVGLIDEKARIERDTGAQATALLRWALDPYHMVKGCWRAKINRWNVARQTLKSTLRINKCASS